MTDRRRRRWVAHDVYFLDDSLGATVYDRFGAAGVALWFGFIAACKKSHVEGSVTYSNDVEALSVFGLPGMPLSDAHGVPFDLDDFWKVLSDHKVIRRNRRRGRLTRVECSKWDDWQRSASRQRAADREADRRGSDGPAGSRQVDDRSTAGRPQVDDRLTEPEPDPDSSPTADVQNRRSDPHFTATEPPRNRHGPATDSDSDMDSEKPPLESPPSQTVEPFLPAGTRGLLDDSERLCSLLAESLTRTLHVKVPNPTGRDWLKPMVALIREQQPDGAAKVESGIRWLHSGTGDAPFWAGVVTSPAKLRKHFVAMAAAAANGRSKREVRDDRLADWVAEQETRST